MLTDMAMERTAQNNITVILPSLNPDEKLRGVIEGLLVRGFDDIVVINDGSDAEHARYFPQDGEYEGVTMLVHSVNRGKGAALRTGFEYVMKNRMGKAGVVTVDGDGQHAAQDIEKVARALCETPDTLILGARDFSLPEVPARSRKGNRMTSFVFRTGVGMKISDTQTGLRGIPFSALPVLMEVRGDRYEYETNMLLALRPNDIPYREVPISTLYIEENKSSHFRPVVDSVKIYANILKYTLNSIVSSLLDLLIFYLILRFVFHGSDEAVFVCTVIARVLSNVFNFAVSQILVFGNKSDFRNSFMKYLVVSVVQMMLSALLVYLISVIAGADNSALKTAIKIPVDVFLFFVSYFVQKKWVFAAKRGRRS